MTYQKTGTKDIKKTLTSRLNHKFSVRQDKGTASHWVNISWEDGPTTSQVQAITNGFNDSKHDDMTTDLWCGSQYTTEHREISNDAYLWAVRKAEKDFGVKVKLSREESWNGGYKLYISHEDDIFLTNCDRYLSQEINQIISNRDFREINKRV